MKLAIVVLVALAACRGNKSAANGKATASGSATKPAATAKTGSAANDPCAHVADGVASIWKQQVAEATSDAMRKASRKRGDEVIARLVRHCRDDHWSPAVIACMRTAKPTCMNMLTPEQHQKLTADNPNKPSKP